MAQNATIRQTRIRRSFHPLTSLCASMYCMPPYTHRRPCRPASPPPLQLPTHSQDPGTLGAKGGLTLLPIVPPCRKYHSNLLSLRADLPKFPRIDVLAAAAPI